MNRERSNQQTPQSPQTDAHFIVLAAVSVAIALLLFLDVFLPIIPDRLALPGGDDPAEDPTEAGIGAMYYTEEEALEAWYDDLVKTLKALESGDLYVQPDSGCKLGLFDFDLQGVPELIVRSGAEDGGGYTYSATAIDTGVTLATWTGGTGDQESLYVCETDDAGDPWHPYMVIFTHDGDGNDEFVFRLSLTGQFYCDELFSMEKSGFKANYYVEYSSVGRSEYKKAYDRFTDTNPILEETALRLTAWQQNDPEGLAKSLLTNGQKFVRTDQTDLNAIIPRA